jgi:hypothetical protein
MNQREVDERIIIAFAGPAAEARQTGRMNWGAGSDDYVFAFELASELTHFKVDDIDPYLRYLWARAE